MARKPKQGLDYFPLDVHMEDKIELLEAQHGLIGFAVYIKLLQKIYSEGYWYKFGEEELLLTSKRINVDINTINDIINTCLSRNIFDKCIFDKYSVLTSSGIQKRFFEIVGRRKGLTINQDFLIINVDINRDNVSMMLTETPINVDISTQSKVKEIKEKNIYSIAFENAWSDYERKGTKKPSYQQWTKLSEKDKMFAKEMISEYKKEQPEIKYRKDFERYLKDKVFEAVSDRMGFKTNKEETLEEKKSRLQHEKILRMIAEEEEADNE